MLLNIVIFMAYGKQILLKYEQPNLMLCLKLHFTITQEVVRIIFSGDRQILGSSALEKFLFWAEKFREESLEKNSNGGSFLVNFWRFLGCNFSNFQFFPGFLRDRQIFLKIPSGSSN